jgi:hypothetical protein
LQGIRGQVLGREVSARQPGMVQVLIADAKPDTGKRPPDADRWDETRSLRDRGGLARRSMTEWDHQRHCGGIPTWRRRGAAWSDSSDSRVRLRDAAQATSVVAYVSAMADELNRERS